MRHLGVTTLLTMLLLLLPAAARADLDLGALGLFVTTEGTNGIDANFEVVVLVVGTGIASATLTPAGGSAISLPCKTDATGCGLAQGTTSQAALDALLPTTARQYTIKLTGTVEGETVTGTFSFGRPAVPSPAISAPLAGSTLLPGPLQVKYLGCATTTCNAATEGVLKESGVEKERKSDLPAPSTSWTPATSLGQESDFSVQITHAAETSTNATADKVVERVTEDDNYLLASLVTHSDQVSFATGFPPPMGSFCIVVNHDAADDLDPTGCTVIDEPPAGILDTRGSFSTSAAGIEIEYGLLLAANGRLSGIAAADLDGDGSFEALADLVGKLRGQEGQLRQKLRVRFDDPGSETRLQLRIREEANLATLLGASLPPLEWLVEQRLRGKLAGAKLFEVTTAVRTLPAPPASGWAPCDGGTSLSGWKLSFTLTGSDGPISGNLELASCIDVALTGTQSFDTLSNQSSLRLGSEGAERGVRMQVKRLVIDATLPAEDQITAAAVRFRAFGQGGSLLVP